MTRIHSWLAIAAMALVSATMAQGADDRAAKSCPKGCKSCSSKGNKCCPSQEHICCPKCCSDPGCGTCCGRMVVKFVARVAPSDDSLAVDHHAPAPLQKHMAQFLQALARLADSAASACLASRRPSGGSARVAPFEPFVLAPPWIGFPVVGPGPAGSEPMPSMLAPPLPNVSALAPISVRVAEPLAWVSVVPPGPAAPPGPQVYQYAVEPAPPPPPCAPEGGAPAACSPATPCSTQSWPTTNPFYTASPVQPVLPQSYISAPAPPTYHSVPVMPSPSSPESMCLEELGFLRVGRGPDKGRLELVTGGATRLTCENLSVAAAGNSPIKIAVHAQQVQVSGSSLQALADRIALQAPQDRLVLDGHVKLKYHKAGQRVAVTAGQVIVGLTDGQLEVKPAAGGSASSAPATPVGSRYRLLQEPCGGGKPSCCRAGAFWKKACRGTRAWASHVDATDWLQAFLWASWLCP